MPKVVVIGAGIVGSSLADELTARGWTDVTVLDRGPLFATGGSTSHAPGLVFQTNPSKTMTEFAALHRREVRRPRAPDGWALQRRSAGWRSPPRRSAGPICTARPAGRRPGASMGELLVPGRMRRAAPAAGPATASSADSTRPTDGLAKAVRAAEAQARRATAPRRALPRPAHRSPASPSRTAGSPASHRPAASSTPTSWSRAAGFWGAADRRAGRPHRPAGADGPPVREDRAAGALVGRNDRLTEAGLPILRHQDQDLYFREHGDRIGIGYYGHRPMPVDMVDAACHDTAGDADAVDAAVHRGRLRPCLAASASNCFPALA